MSISNKARHCQAQTKLGKPCEAAAMEGGLCFFHANPNKAVELGRIGGRKNRYSANEHVDPPPDLNTALAVQETGKRIVTDVLAGKMDHRIAASLRPCLDFLLRAIEATDVERRLGEVEKQLNGLAEMTTDRTKVVSNMKAADSNGQAVATPERGANLPTAPMDPVLRGQDRRGREAVSHPAPTNAMAFDKH